MRYTSDSQAHVISINSSTASPEVSVNSVLGVNELAHSDTLGLVNLFWFLRSAL